MKAFFSNLFARLTGWVKKLLSEDNGNPSSIRLVMFGWHLAAMLVWIVVSFAHMEMAHVNQGILAVLALVSGTKVAQKIWAEAASGLLTSPAGSEPLHVRS